MPPHKLRSHKSRKSSAKLKRPTLEDVKLRVEMGGPLSTDEAALYLNLSVGTLHVYRCKGVGPRCVYAASMPRYTKEDLDEWVRGGKPKKATEVMP